MPASMNSDLLVVLNMSIIAVIQVIVSFRFGDVHAPDLFLCSTRFGFLFAAKYLSTLRRGVARNLPCLAKVGKEFIKKIEFLMKLY